MPYWLLLLAILVAAAPPALAADEPPSTTPRTLAYLGAGYASGDHMGSAAFGGTLVRDLASRLSLEATASYLGRTMGDTGASASASLLVHLRPLKEKAVPYLAVGGGLYRSDAQHERARGRMAGPGRRGGFGMMGGPSTYGPMMGGGRWMDPGDGRWDRGASTDAAVTIGGGLRIDVGSRVFVRPDLRALVVPSSGDTRTVGLFSVGVGYGF